MKLKQTVKLYNLIRMRGFVETFHNAVSLIHNDLQIYGLRIQSDSSNIFYEESKKTVAFKRLTKRSLSEPEQKVQITKDLVKLGTLFYNSTKKSIIKENFLLCDLVCHLASCHSRKSPESKMKLHLLILFSCVPTDLLLLHSHWWCHEGYTPQES